MFYSETTTLATQLFLLVRFTPLSLAEFFSVGRTNSPWMANLALCARTAHQSGFVGNTGKFRHPECFFSRQVKWAAFSGYSLWLLTKSNSPAVREPQCFSKQSRRHPNTKTSNTAPSTSNKNKYKIQSMPT